MAKTKGMTHGTDAETGRDKPAATGNGKPKTTCPLTKEEFLSAAGKGIKIQVGDEVRLAQAREFSSGSFGFYFGDKVTLMIGDVPITFQCGVSITAVGSKPDGKSKE